MAQDTELRQRLQRVRDFVRWGASRFNEAGLWFGHGTDNAWDDALVLVMHALHLPDEQGPEVLDAQLLDAEKTAVLKLLRRRLDERLPAPYITGEAWFAGLRFQVDQRVLIPRSPLAELIDRRFSPWLTTDPARILDLCTGCGCIGIACAYAFPDAEIDLSDVSQDALDVADLNIAGHGLQERTRTLASDLFAKLDGPYDLIVANPPYVDEEDLAMLPDEYRHEPLLALASGADGLDLTRRLLQEAEQHLTEEGVLIVELGNSWVHLDSEYPQIDFNWLEFEHGGHGVFALTRRQLQANRQYLTRPARRLQ